MSEEDFIQQAVNKGYEESVNRWRKKINYRIAENNRLRNIKKRRRKIERQCKRKARLHK